MVAVDLGGSSLRAVQFTLGKNVPTLGKVAYAPLPPGAVVGGEVKDVEAVSAALKDMWAREKFSTKQVVFGLANTGVLVRQIDLDWDVEADFRKSLKYQVADYLTMDVEEAILDYHTLAEYEVADPAGEPLRKKQILIVAANKEMVGAFVEAFRKAGLRPTKADIVPFALIRAANPQPASAETAEVAVDMGLDVTSVIIHQGGQPRFVRMVSGQGGRALNSELCKAFGWSEEDAERSKIQLGLTAPGAGAQPHPAQQIINHVVSAWINEIRNSVDFYLQNTPQVNQISRLVLTGGSANIKGLAQRLASELRVTVEYGTPVHAVPTGKKVTVPEGTTEQQLSVAVGLAMGA